MTNLFSGWATTVDYQLVSRDTLAALPLVSSVLEKHSVPSSGILSMGILNWSMAHQPHILRMRTAQPVANLNTLDNAYADDLRQLALTLETYNAMVVPGGMHPILDPFHETHVSHPKNERERLYQELFGCAGHAWVNQCQTKVEIPFPDDEAFGRLHAAVRIVLPIIPALSAASPLVEGRCNGMRDNRLRYLRTRYMNFPSVSGKLIPEPVFSEKRYREQIYGAIAKELIGTGMEGRIEAEELNNRAAIPHFDRKTIEIRIMEPQECPAAEMAIIKLITELIRALVEERFISFEEQTEARMEILCGILADTIEQGGKAEVFSSEYLSFFGLGEVSNVSEIWKRIFDTLSRDPLKPLALYEKELSVILDQGCLSDRIITVLGEKPHPEAIRQLWHRLADCLQQNKLLIL